ncbi:lipase family protein [Nocardia sp. NPDC059154]|uniref:lipase family protein n=1 Tax=Nocardia sp. NPDC059154 TaxID=3346744 RepID=UPI003680EBFE
MGLRRRIAASFVAAAVMAVSVASTAAARPSGDFYDPPAQLPAEPGQIIRSEAFTPAVPAIGDSGLEAATALRIMYRSNDTHGDPLAVTGSYFEPIASWRGPGPRPLIVVAPGTVGQGPQCAPSKLFGDLAHYQPPFMTAYEATTVYPLLALGAAVVMTDYDGLGMPGVHDYVNRLAEAHAVLDSARAARNLPDAEITERTPIVLFGYSQGGQASAAAAELHSAYAPDLNIVGAYAGGVPADLRANFAGGSIDSGPLAGAGGATGLIGYFLNGVYADYPQIRPEIDRMLNDAGWAMLRAAAGMCIPETTLRFGWHPSNEFTSNAMSFSEWIANSPLLGEIVDEQRLGGAIPDMPVLLMNSTSDDVMPFEPVRRLAQQWCARGATVQLTAIDSVPSLLPSSGLSHSLADLPAMIDARDWIMRLLSGAPAPSDCTDLP